MLGLIACSLPVVALGTLLGGIDPVALTGSFVVLVGVAMLGCTLALTLSVWGRKTHEVLLATYFVWVVWVPARPRRSAMLQLVRGSGMNPPDWIIRSNVFVLAVGGNDASLLSSSAVGDQLLSWPWRS